MAEAKAGAGRRLPAAAAAMMPATCARTMAAAADGLDAMAAVVESVTGVSAKVTRRVDGGAAADASIAAASRGEGGGLAVAGGAAGPWPSVRPGEGAADPSAARRASIWCLWWRQE